MSLSIEVSRPFRLRGFATGGYMCKCATCGGDFTGDKRAICCLPCAVDAAEAARSDPKPAVEGGGGEKMEASRSQPSGMGPSDHIGPQSQHSDGGRDV